MTQLAICPVNGLDETWDCQGENVVGCWIRRDPIDDVFVEYPPIGPQAVATWELPPCGALEYCWPNVFDDLEAS